VEKWFGTLSGHISRRKSEPLLDVDRIEEENFVDPNSVHALKSWSTWDITCRSGRQGSQTSVDAHSSRLDSE
jgi:hypothetical protein